MSSRLPRPGPAIVSLLAGLGLAAVLVVAGVSGARAEDPASPTPAAPATSSAPSAEDPPATGTASAPATTSTATPSPGPSTGTAPPAPTAAPTPAPAAATAAASGPGAGDVVTGTVVRAWTEDEQTDELAARGRVAGPSEPVTWIQTADAAVRVPTQQLADVPVGATVQVSLGAPTTDAASGDGLEPAHEVLAADVVAAPAEPAPVTQAAGGVTDEVTVVMAVPAGGQRDSTTLAQVEAAIGGPVQQFWSDQSGGQIQVGVAATGNRDWIQLSYGCSQPGAMWDQAAAAAGWTPGPGKHLLVYLSSLPDNLAGCSYGLGEVGSGIGDGGRVYVRATVTSLIAHELGHNFGLGHSSGLQCDGTVDSGTCGLTPYRDYYDVMGASWNRVGSLNAAQADALGLLPSGQRQDVLSGTAGGTYTLAPLSATSGTRAVRITDVDGESFYVELRTPSGQDSWLTGSGNVFGLDAGVTIRLQQDPPLSDTSLLLDATPSTQAGWSRDLKDGIPLGRSATIGGGEWTVRVTAQTAGDATVTVAHETPIQTRWLDSGGAGGPLGAATAAETCGGGGCSRTFDHGNLYWTAATGVRLVTDDVLTAWTATGGVSGPLGWPTSDLLTVPGGTAQAFQGGSVYASAATGAHAVRGAIRSAWWATGGVTGPLGFPAGDYTDVAGGAALAFTGGTMYWSSASGTHSVSGAVGTAFDAAGGVAGPLGFPTSDLLTVPGGSAQAFQSGSIYRSAATGAHVVRGAIRSAWWATGGISGPLGFPASDYAAVTGGFAVAFQGGSFYESPATGAHAVRGVIRSAWWGSGGTAGSLGFPTSEVLTVPGGTAQAFSGGSVYASAATGAAALPSSFLGPWWATGGVSGPFGFPTTGVLTVPGGSAVAFQGGSVYSSPTTGARAVSGAIRSAWWSAGGVSGGFGFPTSGLLSVPGGSAQAFSGGSVYSSPAFGTHGVPTDFLGPWWAAGGVSGRMGFPLSDVVSVPGGTAQAFAGGSIYRATAGAAHAVYGPTRSAWWSTGGVSGPLGFPTGDTTAVGAGSATRFSGGLLAGTAARMFRVNPDFLAALDRAGGATALGLPTSAESIVPGGTAQAFERGSVYAASAGAAQVVSGPLRSAWWSTGGVSGPHGFPTGDVTAVTGSNGAGQSLDFSDGTLYWSAGTGAHFVESPVDALYRGDGGPAASALGWPLDDTHDDAGRRANRFQGGPLAV